MIKVVNLSASYQAGTILHNINFCIEDGSFTALCGKNGAGKSTLLSLMAGIVPAGLSVSGDILIDGKSVFKMKRKEAVHKVSYLIQNESPVWNFTVSQFIETGLYSSTLKNNAIIQKEIDAILKSLNIESFKNKKLFELSGGEFQKCRLARCLILKSNNMLFDEPSENLDLPFQFQFLNTIKNLSKNQNKCCVFSIHDINTASLFTDNFLLLYDKSIISGTTHEVFTQEILSKAFNSEVCIYTHPKANKLQVLFNANAL